LSILGAFYKTTAAGGGSLELLHEEILGSDTDSWSVTPSEVAFDWDFTAYSKFIVIMSHLTDGTGGVETIRCQVSSVSSQYHYLQNIRSGTTETYTAAGAQDGIDLSYIQTETNISVWEIYLNMQLHASNDGIVFNCWNERMGAASVTSTLGFSGIAVTSISALNFTNEGDGNFKTGSVMSIYGLKK
jgi:hypothetical protein